VNIVNRLTLRFLCCSFAITCWTLPTLADPRGVEVVPQQPIAGLQLKTFVSPEDGVSFGFPVNWSVQEKPDKDTIMKANADAASDLNGEVSFNRLGDMPPGSEKEAATIIENGSLAKLSAYKKLGEQKLVFGPQRLSGIGQIFTATVNGINIWQRRIYFSSTNGHLLVLSFTCPPQQSQNLVLLSNNILASVRENHSAGAAAAIPPINPYSTYVAKFAGLSFAYPSDWQVQNAHENNLEVKLAGNGANGKRGEISLHSTEGAYLTSEDLGRAIEAEALKSPVVKGYSHVSDEGQNFGSSLNLPGFVTESTFEYSGLPARQIVGSFKEGDRHFVIGVRGVNWTSNEIHSLFSKVISSIKFTN
jgi:hypothetical protein